MNTDSVDDDIECKLKYLTAKHRALDIKFQIHGTHMSLTLF